MMYNPQKPKDDEKKYAGLSYTILIIDHDLTTLDDEDKVNLTDVLKTEYPGYEFLFCADPKAYTGMVKTGKEILKKFATFISDGKSLPQLSTDEKKLHNILNRRKLVVLVGDTTDIAGRLPEFDREGNQVTSFGTVLSDITYLMPHMTYSTLDLQSPLEGMCHATNGEDVQRIFERADSKANKIGRYQSSISKALEGHLNN